MCVLKKYTSIARLVASQHMTRMIVKLHYAFKDRGLQRNVLITVMIQEFLQFENYKFIV